MFNKNLKIVAAILAILSFPPSMYAEGNTIGTATFKNVQVR